MVTPTVTAVPSCTVAGSTKPLIPVPGGAPPELLEDELEPPDEELLLDSGQRERPDGLILADDHFVEPVAAKGGGCGQTGWPVAPSVRS